MNPSKGISQAARELAMKRHASLSPARRKEIASLAGKASVKARKDKKSTVSSKDTYYENR